MSRRIPLAAATAGGGMLAAAFLSTTVAAADDSGAGEAPDISSNAFTVPDGTTFDPGTDGFNDVNSVLGGAPLLAFGTVNQDLDVYVGGNDVGSATTSVDASSILGIENAQFTVTGVTANADTIEAALTADGSNVNFDTANFDAAQLAAVLADPDADFALNYGDGDITTEQVKFAVGASNLTIQGTSVNASDIADALNDAGVTANLPDDGSVYSVTDLTSGLPGLEAAGLGIYNVYEATPGEDGANIQDVLVTPLGNFDLSTMFNAISPFDLGSTTGGVDASGGGLFGGDDAGLGDLFGVEDGGGSDILSNIFG